MSKFEKENFEYFGGYLNYRQNGYNEHPTFVARFKYTNRDKATFQSFLIKNFTVEEYFGAYEAGESPVKILESKGYVSATVKKILKSEGYPQTLAGRDQHIRDGIAARKARRAS